MTTSDIIQVIAIITSLFMSTIAIVIPFIKEQAEKSLRIRMEQQNLQIKITQINHDTMLGKTYLYVSFINKSSLPLSITESTLTILNRNNYQNVDDFGVAEYETHKMLFLHPMKLIDTVPLLNSSLPININPYSTAGGFISYQFPPEYLNPEALPQAQNYEVTFQTTREPIFLLFNPNGENLLRDPFISVVTKEELPSVKNSK